MSDDSYDDDPFDECNNGQISRIQKQDMSIIKKRKVLWVEKYRPKKLDDVVQQDDIIKILKKTIQTGELPHLLLFGPSGTGKTSTVLALAMELFGPNKIEERVIEINASDDGKIGAVRKSVVKFAKMAVGTPDPAYPCPPFKIVILDEADAMTPEAQAALRRIMELTSEITRFCFVCNYVSQITEPIISRCMKFRFSPLGDEKIIERLELISKNENINVGKKVLLNIARVSEGDARRAIMMLQNTKYLSKYKQISPNEIIRMTGGILPNDMPQLWTICTHGNIIDIKQLCQKIINKGYQIQSILSHLKNIIIESSVDDNIKGKILLEMSFADRRLHESSDEYLQLLGILLLINNLCKY